jgi:hypothetical protein
VEAGPLPEKTQEVVFGQRPLPAGAMPGPGFRRLVSELSRSRERHGVASSE